MTTRTKAWLLGVAGLILWMVLAIVLATVLGLKGGDFWTLVAGLWVLGLVAGGLLSWYFRDVLFGAATTPAAADDIDTAVAAARARLAGARTAPATSLRRLPALIVLGPAGSAKTTVVVRSGFDPELLAGDVFRGDAVAPTPAVNFWITEGTVVAEAGSGVTTDAGRFGRLLGHLVPQRMRAALGGAQPARAAVVCLSCDDLFAQGAAESVPATARTLRERLAEASRRLGVRLPVYVLFTKADRVPHYADFVQNLSRDEALEVLGATIDADEGAAGTYADRAAAVVRGALDGLYRSLAERRLLLLPREHSAPRRLSGYEFPREFRKLIPLVEQFLVELCRPGQLQMNPFLRGFYFTGVQAVVVSDAAPAAVAPVAPTPAAGSAKATAVFDASRIAAAAAAAAPAPAAGTRKVPRWNFLPRVLRDVVLKDEAALGVTRVGGTRANVARRVLLGAVAAAAMVAALGFTVSYGGNRRLQRETRAAGAAMAALPPGGAELPSVDALRRLDSLRASLARLRGYQAEGAPLRLRWGLYAGDALIPEARRAYFTGLDRLGLGPTRQALAQTLRALPDAPGATADYGPTYATLKAHLITTTEPARSTPEFLSPVLLSRWLAGREPDAERTTLLRRQLDFYADELRRFGDPYAPSTADVAAVERARGFLAKFAGAGEGIYQFMLSEAAKGNPPVRLAQRVPTAAGYVSDPYEVPGAFTAGGWAFMQTAFKSADKYFAGESWVVGEQAGPPVDRAAVIAQLKARYAADYVRHWRQFVRAATVTRYASVRDAAQKLTVLSGNQSPVLGLLSLVAQNTDVDSATAAAFQPVHAVTPPKVTDKLIGETNGGYVNALVGLQAALEQAAAAPPGQGDAAVAPAAQSAQQAKLAARQLAQGFRIDPETHLETAVQKLLEDPVTNAEPLLKRFGAAELNEGGRSFCSTFRGLMAKYPFNPSPTAPQATLQEVNTVFRPVSGALWTMYASTLQNALVKQGAVYVPKPGGSPAISPAFVEFFNRAAAVTDALYKEGATEPKLTFSVKPTLSEVTSAVSITVDGQTATSTRNSSQTRQMEWPGAGVRDGRISATLGGVEVTLLSYEGPWSAFRLFQEAESWTTAGAVHRLEWTLRTRGQQATLADGTPVKVAAELNLGATPPVFRRGYFSGLGCVSEVAR